MVNIGIFGRRSQAAMEFLMTYGWAILVVLAAIISLAFFGVMSPAKFLPESCTVSSTSGMACLDFKVLPDSAHMLIINSGGRDVLINNVTVGDCSTDFSYSLPDGSSHLFSVTGCSYGSIGSKKKMGIEISYTDNWSHFTKSVSGSITAVIT